MRPWAFFFARQRGDLAKEVVVDDKEEVKEINIFEAWSSPAESLCFRLACAF